MKYVAAEMVVERFDAVDVVTASAASEPVATTKDTGFNLPPI